MEFEDSEVMKINLKRESQENPDISKISNSDQFDNYLHVSPIKLPKHCKNIPKDWLVYQILALARYRIDLDSFAGPLADYLNNHEKFQLLDNNGKRLKVKNFVIDYEKDIQLIRYFFKLEFSNYHNKVFGEMKLLHKNINDS